MIIDSGSHVSGALAYRQNPDTMDGVNSPVIVEAESFQEAYFAALSEVQGHKWECWNLVAQIGDPLRLDESVNTRVTEYALSEGLHRPLNVAYTIFPHRLAQGRSRVQLYELYKERLLPRYPQWGTYFGRLIAYPGADGPVNQLESAIASVLSSEDTYRACCTFLIPRPGTETRRHRGAPCLNYLALQLEPAEQRVASLLAVYRNHDFRERAYGNYWGLCNLLMFLSRELDCAPGRVTCVSSHAYVADGKRALGCLLEEYL
ncbi:MAG: hypothetical protein AB7V19_05305 [Candidatus Bipolaricaulia bacterium]